MAAKENRMHSSSTNSKLRVALAALVAAACGGEGDYYEETAEVSEELTTTTVRFQNGAFPTSSYAGTEDSWIRRDFPGQNYATSQECLVNGTHYGVNEERECLVRFTVRPTIPWTATITAAKLTFQITTAASANAFNIHGLKRYWPENEVSWNFYRKTVICQDKLCDPTTPALYPWQIAGAKGANDRGDLVGTIPANATGRTTVTLNAAGLALIQSWVGGRLTGVQPTGFIIVNEAATRTLSVRSSEASVITERPLLEVTYTTP
jgi:hypothetical protein